MKDKNLKVYTLNKENKIFYNKIYKVLFDTFITILLIILYFKLLSYLIDLSSNLSLKANQNANNKINLIRNYSSDFLTYLSILGATLLLPIFNVLKEFYYKLSNSVILEKDKDLKDNFPIIKDYTYNNNIFKIHILNNMLLKNCIIYDCLNNQFISKNLFIKNDIIEFNYIKKINTEILIVLNSLYYKNPVIKLNYKFNNIEIDYLYTTDKDLNKWLYNNQII